jgi:hypothetical protein
MALTTTGLVIEMKAALLQARRTHDEAVLAAARAIDRGDEADLETQRVQILVSDARINLIQRWLEKREGNRSESWS